jgi:MFS family permease
LSRFDLEPEAVLAGAAGITLHDTPAAAPAESIMRSFIAVALCSLTLFLNNGFMLIGKSVFDPMMVRRLDVPIGVLKASDTILYMTVALAAPLAGYFMDRIGPRALFAAGFVLMSAGLVLYAGSNSIIVVYGVHVMFGLCLVCSGSYACVIVVSEATARRRGLAIGILLASASFGTGVAPGAYTLLTDIIGWQGALRLAAAVTICVLPAVVLLPRRLDRIVTPGVVGEGSATLASALCSANFWLLTLIAAIGFLVAIGLSSNMVLFLTNDIGLSAGRINLLLLVMSIAGLSAQLLTGALSDLVNRRLVHTISILVMAAGCLMFHARAEWLIWIAGLCFAIGWGGHYVLLQSLLPYLFSGPAFGRIVGVIALIEALGGSAGPSIIGTSFDVTASYQLAFTMGAVALLLTAAIAARINSVGAKAP